MESCEAVVIGGGVVGLAIARALALSGREVMILERNAHPGMETSSRNSEVIHAGIYYPKGSLKASLCVAGREMLYAFCEARGVPHRRIGKLIFATDASQFGSLYAIQSAADAAGVRDIRWLDRADVTALESDLSCEAALLSPSTGILSVHDYMLALLGEASANDALFVQHVDVTHVERSETGEWLISIRGEDAPALSTPILVNAAGLDACRLAATIEALPAAFVPPFHLARGVYFSCTRRLPFQHLLYPVPVPGGLGTHLTFDLAHQARFGPDVEWIDSVDYTVDVGRHGAFLAAARLIYPALEPEDLVPAFAGIRPKISAPNQPAADFMISTPADHGLPGLVNLFGIESPGITSSLAIAERVAAALQDH